KVLLDQCFCVLLLCSFSFSALFSQTPSRSWQMAAHTEPGSAGGFFLLKGNFSWRGADGVGVKRATIYGGYSPRSGRPGFESRRHLPNVSPSFLSAYCQKIKIRKRPLVPKKYL
ncbi:hypothetical protein ATANTOWER_026395, partial [Ataeniobius toweri]|nr:hypothetical protein [Ataeniobius toweri]